MKKAAEYWQRADECRALARKMKDGEQQDQLLGIAKMWEALAEDRERLTRLHPELATEGEDLTTDAALGPHQLRA